MKITLKDGSSKEYSEAKSVQMCIRDRTESEQQWIDKLHFEKKLRNSTSFFNEIGIEIVLMLYHYND